MKNNISEHYSECGTKKAIVVKYGEDYSIDFYCDGKYNHTIMCSGMSVQYVEDCAENYALGIYKSIKDFE